MSYPFMFPKIQIVHALTPKHVTISQLNQLQCVICFYLYNLDLRDIEYSEDCVELWPQGWNDVQCTWAKNVICQVKEGMHIFLVLRYFAYYMHPTQYSCQMLIMFLYRFVSYLEVTNDFRYQTITKIILNVITFLHCNC